MTDNGTPEGITGTHLASDGRIREDGTSRFGAHKPSVAVPGTVTPALTLEVGETVEVGARNADSPLQVCRVTRYTDGFLLEADQMLDLADLAPEGVDKIQWVRRNRHVIHAFIDERYNAFPLTPLRIGETVIDYTAELDDKSGTITADRALERLEDETLLTKLWEENDENAESNLATMVNDRIAKVAVTSALWSRGDLDGVTFAEVDAMVESANEHGIPVDDWVATSIAHRTFYLTHQLSIVDAGAPFYELQSRGFTDRSALITKIDELSTRDDIASHKHRLDALKFWAENA